MEEAGSLGRPASNKSQDARLPTKICLEIDTNGPFLNFSDRGITRDPEKFGRD